MLPVSELTDVLSAIESLSARGERLALATIVEVRGSTYRRSGARLLVPEEGAPIGNISGGCLENDVADVARIVMREGHARVVSFDLTADDEAVWGWGLGCNGAIELFVEPADKAAEVARALRLAPRRAADPHRHGARRVSPGSSGEPSARDAERPRPEGARRPGADEAVHGAADLLRASAAIVRSRAAGGGPCVHRGARPPPAC
jgi:xanthine/CO dehydrogenase XdhC/CoxF family maturation factor